MSREIHTTDCVTDLAELVELVECYREYFEGRDLSTIYMHAQFSIVKETLTDGSTVFDIYIKTLGGP